MKRQDSFQCSILNSFILAVTLQNLTWAENVPGLLQTFAKSLCANAWAQNDAHFRIFITELTTFSSQNCMPVNSTSNTNKISHRTVLLGFKIRAEYLHFSAPSSLKNGALLEDMGEYWRYSSKLAEPQRCLVLVTTHNSQCLQKPVPKGRLKWNNFHFKQRPGWRTSSNYNKF